MAGIYRNLWYNVCKYGLSILPDTLFHNMVAFIMHRRFKCNYHWMNIKEPKTFSEKLQYIKTHPVCDSVDRLADKYDVRDYVKSIIGEKYLIPILGVYSSVEEININSLPNEFVIKLTKGSGYNLIVPDKKKLNIEKAKITLTNWLNINPYYMSREPHYRGKSKLICEQMLEYNITDYKFFCFDGHPIYVELYMDRFGNHKKIFYDMNWNRMPFTTGGDECDLDVDKPDEFDEMFEVAQKLSQSLAFVRVDLYVHNKNVYFGEMTFHPAGGYTPITPYEWDYKLGELIKM